jgi:HK97 family phage prohead protease
LVERAAVSALYWAQPCRRSETAVRGSLAGLSDAERLQVCGILAGGELDRLSDDELLGRMHELATKAHPIEDKIIHGEAKTTMLAEPTTDVGWFEGIANVTGVRDRQGDLSVPGAFTRTVDDLNAGRVAWTITRQHSGDPFDVVGHVVAAKETAEGLWIRAAWTPDAIAQQFRSAVASGVRLGLSITYVPRGARSDAQGGRLLSDIDVTSIAITNDPASPGSYIRAGKGVPAMAGLAAAFDRVVTTKQEIAEGSARRERESSQRRAEDAMLAAASWPPPHFPRETRLALIRAGAESKARRELAGDPARARAQARRDCDNTYSNVLARTMARLERERCGHRSCMPGRCVYGG